MGISLKKLLEASAKGCIDDNDKIADIFAELIGMKADAFQCSLKEHLLTYNQILLEGYYVDVKKCRHEVTYGEILCMIDNIRCEKYIDEPSDEQLEIYAVEYASYIMNVLISASEKVNTVRLFANITVKGYLCHLADRMGYKKRGRTALYHKFRRKLKSITGFELDDTTRIDALFRELKRFQERAWLPEINLWDYGKDMRASYDILHEFMIGYFKKAYPECFDIDRIIKKYDEFSWR